MVASESTVADGIKAGLLSGLMPAVVAEVRRALANADGPVADADAPPFGSSASTNDQRGPTSLADDPPADAPFFGLGADTEPQRGRNAHAENPPIDALVKKTDALVKELGVPDGAKAAVIAALAMLAPGPVLLVTAQPRQARAMLDDLPAWLPSPPQRLVLPFPARESLPYEQRRTDSAAAHARLRVLAALAAGERPLIVTDVQALSQRTLRRGVAPPALRAGAPLAIEPFLTALDAAGYRAAAVVDERGAFARRGGIIDIFPPTAARPLRIELIGDEVESVRHFDPVTQRSIEPVAEATLGVASEAAVDEEARTLAASLPARGEPPSSSRTWDWSQDLDQIERGALPTGLDFWTPFLARGALWDHLPPTTLLVWDEPDDGRRHLNELDDLAVRARESLERRGEIPAGLPLPHMPCNELLAGLGPLRPRIDLNRFTTHVPDSPAAAASPPGTEHSAPARSSTEPAISAPPDARRASAGSQPGVEQTDPSRWLKTPPGSTSPQTIHAAAASEPGAEQTAPSRWLKTPPASTSPDATPVAAASEPVAEQTAPARWLKKRLGFASVNTYGGRLHTLIDDLRRAHQRADRITVVSLQAARLAELFDEYGLAVQRPDTLPAPPSPGAVTILRGSLPQGWRLRPDNGGGEQILITDTEIFGFAKQRRLRAPSRSKHPTFLQDLRPGDFVVHIEHGIGRFVGVTRERIGEREREYLELEYAESDRLLVPTDQLHRLQRYVGPGDGTPSLTRLGTQHWRRAKERVSGAVRDLAEQLLQLHAARQFLPGIAAPPDGPWQMELEAAFPYVETADQIEAVRAAKADMERPRPMDRIIVGDVGYGKTEVAVRAAFKSVTGGYQVAMLVPTTVLAQQHFSTFRERMAPFPVRIEMLSRFRSPAKQKAIVAGLDGGAIDVVIGTHRLLQKDVRFKSLGLVIIDEEQRFGVAHKETLKQLRREVDVLTLSATPIPRTLHMALSGIRDTSTIETPPEERLPITTYVMETDDRVVREAVLRELERGGQVYFVHNRVQSIEGVGRWLRDLVPEARILVGHGQMPEDRLQKVMTAFVAGDADVLLSTTIIESGLDIPNVNTIIVHQAQRFGLAQLYQLRGRVGRSAAQAYAYLLYDRHQPLTETAQKRLQTVFEATELGAGFQIARRDLEIRGTGNMLGAEQSGHIGAVGFELYTQLMADAVEGLRAHREGRPPQPSRRGPTVALDLPLVAHIPDSYIEDLNLRLSIYQQLATLETPEEADAMIANLRDRFGPPPAPVTTLLRTVRVRALAARLGADSLQREEERIVLRLPVGLGFNDAQRRQPLPGGVTMTPRTLRIDLRHHGERWLDALEPLLEQLGAAVPSPHNAVATATATAPATAPP